MLASGDRPKISPRISVVIPTYNRSALLHETLRQLTRQTLPADQFEVIVADDGSDDDTKAVAESFSGELRLKYCFQEDLGCRAGTARNLGARLAAAPILCFLDTGAMAGREFLSRHLAEHCDAGGDPGEHCAIIGYAHNYNPDHPVQEVGEFIGRMTPEEIVERFRDHPGFVDVRYKHYAECGFDLNTRAVPWNLLYTVNFSCRAEDFRAIGGFDDAFRGWGGEDMELGFRLYRHGVPFRISMDAWVIETPHERNMEVGLQELAGNILYYVQKFPEPVMEIGSALVGVGLPFFDWNSEYHNLTQWSRQVRDLTVADELAEAMRGVPAGDQVAVLGSGGVLPDSLPPVIAMDFDRDLLDQAVATGQHVGHHSMGLRTPLADQSVDTVIITSRMAGLWDRWNDNLMREANRISRNVVRTFAEA
jgi:glycosyltransferase involved in cell wall biosynthesis